MKPGSRHTPTVRGVLLLAISVALFTCAGLLAPTLAVEVVHDGDRLVVTAAGSRLEVRTGPLRIDEVTLVASDTIAAPGSAGLRLETEGAVVEPALPRRFDPPGEAPDPVADWWVDDAARRGVVWRHALTIAGPFALDARLRGRTHSELSLRFDGPQGVVVGLRWGLNRNEITVRDAGSRRLLAWTSLDPAPAAAVAGLAATLAGALALAAALAALWTVAGRRLPGRSTPPGSSRPSAGGRTVTVTVAALAVLAGGLSLWLAAGVLGGLPHTADEAVQWLQAQWLLEGRLWQPVTPWQSQLDLPFTYVRDGRWLSQYPVLWPAALAGFAALGVPWLLPPLLGGLQVVLVFCLGRELFGDRTALLAAILATLSPLARVLFATTLSHAGASILLLVFVLLTLRGHRRERPRFGLVAGLVLGLAFGMRPLPAVAAAMTTGAAILAAGGRRRATWRLLAALVLGGVAGAMPTLAVNTAITGSPLRFGYALAEGRIYAVDNVGFALAHLDAIFVHLEAQLLGWGWGLPGRELWLALPFALALLPFVLGRARPADRLLLGAVATAAVLLLGSRAHGLFCYGARYLFEVTPCLLLLIARGVSEISGLDPEERATGTGAPPRLLVTTAARATIAGLALAAAASLPARLALYQGYFDVDRTLVERLRHEGVADAVVLFSDRDWRDWLRAAPLHRPGAESPLVFARSDGDDSILRAHFPERRFWRWSRGELRRAPLVTPGETDLP